MKKNIAILASGSGTNAENIIRYFQKRQTATVGLVITNRLQAQVRQRAEALGVPTAYFAKADWESGESILKLLQQHHIDFVVLAGFLARIPASLLRAYPDRIVNIHPALLPLHGGKGMYGDRVHEAVLADGDTESGITIHFTNEVYDEGRIICQKRCPVENDDTVQTLATRVHALEYEWYPQVIEQLL